ncbi:MAG: TonB-dependent receptor [Gammaproteobacteria bacterium]|nr:TonB-dependent receptor [Gammaproteobacteria bacterium]
MFIPVLPAGAQGASDQSTMRQAESVADDSAQYVRYPAEFFKRYQPNTALDMIRQVPGFQLDEGDENRGFASSAGNVLIADRRPSAKQDALSEILARIPASRVRRIEIIRGQVRDIDLQGQSVVANLVLRDADEAAVQWTAAVRYNIDFGVTKEGAASLSNAWGNIKFNAGIDFRDFIRGDFTPQSIRDGDSNLVESRFDLGDFDGSRGALNVNASTLLGETLLRVNSRFAGETRDGNRLSTRTPRNPVGLPTIEQFPDTFDSTELEIGIDAERELKTGLVGKAIMLFIDNDLDDDSAQRSFDTDGVLVRERVSNTSTESSEAIARLEVNWSGWMNHVLQANAEVAFNTLDNTLRQTDDTGAGPMPVDVPGANSRVEERRVDVVLKDTWTRGRMEYEFGLGAEVSRIRQTGDAELERKFTFLKPQAALTYTPRAGQQTQLRLAREVSQLDFTDFVSATVFEDDDLALGNPNLRPETTWRLQLGHERRFGPDSVVVATVFHDWVSDVEDLLPLTPDFEAPGNIGSGTRWGVDFEGTVPLDTMGLRGAKIDINARWQNSSVTDPVTGLEREFSADRDGGKLFPLEYQVENEYAITVDFRQDFESSRIAWGWDVRARGERPSFKVNEVDIADDGTEFNIFVETTRWLGVKTNLAAENIFDAAETRARTIYVGERGLSAIDSMEYRRRKRGFRINLTVSGNF